MCHSKVYESKQWIPLSSKWQVTIFHLGHIQTLISYCMTLPLTKPDYRGADVFPGLWGIRSPWHVAARTTFFWPIFCPVSNGCSPSVFSYVSYGETGPWCWIKNLKHCQKSNDGFWEQMGLWYIPFAAVAVFSFLFILLTLVVLCCWWIKVKAAPQQASRRKDSVVEAIPLTLLLIVYCVLLIGIEFAGRIVATKKIVLGAWALYADSTPLSGVIINTLSR